MFNFKNFYESSSKIKLWLDDLRPMPTQFDLHAKTAQEAINILKSGNVESISLDHDLGEPENGTGYDVASWIEHAAYDGVIPKISWAIHSANTVGRQRMIQAMQNADKFWQS